MKRSRTLKQDWKMYDLQLDPRYNLWLSSKTTAVQKIQLRRMTKVSVG